MTRAVVGVRIVTTKYNPPNPRRLWLSMESQFVIEGFSYGKVLMLNLEEGGVDNVKVSLVRTGIFDAFDEEINTELPRN